MSMKKHQGEPDDTSESCDENENKVACSHINRAIDFSGVKKALVAKGFLKECSQCPQNESVVEADCDYEYDESLWLCLRCGHQACGRSRGQHALEHFKVPRSDSHALCVNTTMWNLWCYECDNTVNPSCKKKLLEVVEFLKNKSQNSRKQPEKNQNNWALEIVKTTQQPPQGADCFNSHLPRPRGLTNLGNTCFFNSVMQCLGQTPYLLELLEETSEPGQYFCLPGGRVNPDDKEEEQIVVEALEGNLEGWRPLTQTLAHTLRELQSGHSDVFCPRSLLSRLTAKLPQFSGGDQHDAHELLRHLLEAVREEDLRRYQVVILEKLGLHRKTDPASVVGDKRRIVKFYGQQASELLLPTEQVFRGVLISTLQCQECQHTSHREEFFLDLSLPISEKPMPPVLRRKAEDIDDNKPSKHQIKKEKRAERKKKRQKNYNVQHENNTNSSAEALNNDDDNKSESESDADEEDNAEDNNGGKGIESGYNSDKIYNSSPDSNVRVITPDAGVGDSGVPSPAVGMMSATNCTPDNSPASSETNIGDEELNEDFERPESRLSFIKNKQGSDLKMGLEKLSIINDTHSSKATDDSKMDDDQSDEGAVGGSVEKEEKMEEDDEENLWQDRITARYQCEDGEHSVQSYLNQFTACELMTGNNKVKCELCTKRHGGKAVYTNHTKQLLIYNPPAVLILHLKRFQVLRFRSTKLNKMVKFPFLLDLAPFCSKKAQNLPTFEAGQTKVLYSLFGIVEHSGSISGGHYVADVKVRGKLEANSYRWQFLPKNQKNQNGPKGAAGEPSIPPGKWYTISDSHLSEIPENRVLTSQAYLLFYERIL